MVHRLAKNLFATAKEHAVGAIKGRWEQHRQSVEWNRMNPFEREQFLEKRKKESLEGKRENFIDQQHQRKLNEEEERLMATRMKNFEKISAEMKRVEPEKAEAFMEAVEELMENANQYRQQNQHLKGIDHTIEKIMEERIRHLFEQLYPKSPRNPYRVDITMHTMIEQLGLNVVRQRLNHHDN